MKNSTKNFGQRARKAAPGKSINTIVHRVIKSMRALKYFDTVQSATNSTGTVGIENLTPIPQGSAQSQRVGDAVTLQYMDLRFSVNAANTDVFSHMRLFFFIWKENTLLVNPSGTTLFTSATSQSVYTHLDYENRQLYQLVTKDYLLNLTGTATDPTVNTQQDIIRRVPLNSTRIDFTLGATTGFNHLFFTNYSDSLVTPFPIYQFISRVWYYDEES